MRASRASTAPRRPAKAAPGAPKRVDRSALNNRMAAELLREIQIEGKALSTQIERLSQRFL